VWAQQSLLEDEKIEGRYYRREKACMHDKRLMKIQFSNIIRNPASAEWISIIPNNSNSSVCTSSRVCERLLELVRISIGRILKAFFHYHLGKSRYSHMERAIWIQRGGGEASCKEKKLEIWGRMKSNWGWKCYDRAAHSRLPYAKYQHNFATFPFPCLLNFISAKRLHSVSASVPSEFPSRRFQLPSTTTRSTST
jgi:hypothetical protein